MKLNMKPNKIIIIDDAVPFANEIFSHLGKIITLPGREINNATLRNADALIVRSRTQVNQELLQNTSVNFIGSTIVGLDHIDQAWLKSQKIQFYSAQGCNANSVAEFVITCLFQLAEQQEFNLRHKTLGIVGVGNIGSLVNKKANILGIKTLLNDPIRQKNEKNTKKNTPFVDLKTVLSADIVTFHTPLAFKGLDKSYHLLNKDNFQYISSNTILVNASRGGIIDESLWAQTKTQANVIDCWENEPNICTELYKTANYATPHTAGHSLDAKIAGSNMTYHALCKFWDEKPQNQWQKHLPDSPPPFTINCVKQSSQSIVCQILTHTHDPKQDDKAIRADNILAVQQSFEHYRRHYPIYREWHQHTLLNVPEELQNSLTKLGFKIKTINSP